jgi:hypothetical protein
LWFLKRNFQENKEFALRFVSILAKQLLKHATCYGECLEEKLYHKNTRRDGISDTMMEKLPLTAKNVVDGHARSMFINF